VVRSTRKRDVAELLTQDTSFTEPQDHKTYRVQLWDTEGLPFTGDNPEPVRVVRSEEVLERNRFREGKRISHSTAHEWLWITTLPQAAFPATTIRQLGHRRWKQENNGWRICANTGLSSMDFCMLVSTAPNAATLPANENQSPIAAWPQSP